MRLLQTQCPTTALGFLQSENLIERQEAVRSLLKLQSTKEISRLTQKLLAGTLDPGIQLEVIEAASVMLSEDEQFQSFAAQRTNFMDPKSFQECLVGGDPKKGKSVFLNHIAGQCVRCHKYEKKGPGSIIGPNLWKIGHLSPNYLLESLVAPQAAIAKNYGNISVDLKMVRIFRLVCWGKFKGIKERIDFGSYSLISHPDISARSEIVSVMPPMGVLQRSELRDLVAYLTTLCGE